MLSSATWPVPDLSTHIAAPCAAVRPKPGGGEVGGGGGVNPGAPVTFNAEAAHLYNVYQKRFQVSQ